MSMGVHMCTRALCAHQCPASTWGCWPGCGLQSPLQGCSSHCCPGRLLHTLLMVEFDALQLVGAACAQLDCAAKHRVATQFVCCPFAIISQRSTISFMMCRPPRVHQVNPLTLLLASSTTGMGMEPPAMPASTRHPVPSQPRTATRAMQPVASCHLPMAPASSSQQSRFIASRVRE